MPSTWCKDVVDSSVPDIPCDVVPHVIEDTLSQQVSELSLPVDLSDKFVILSMSQWNKANI